jgi:hypothetical protein
LSPPVFWTQLFLTTWTVTVADCDSPAAFFAVTVTVYDPTAAFLSADIVSTIWPLTSVEMLACILSKLACTPAPPDTLVDSDSSPVNPVLVSVILDCPLHPCNTSRVDGDAVIVKLPVPVWVTWTRTGSCTELTPALVPVIVTV